LAVEARLAALPKMHEGAVGLFCSDVLSNRAPPSLIAQWAQMEAVCQEAAGGRRLIVWADGIDDLDELASLRVGGAERPQVSIEFRHGVGKITL